MRGAIIGLALLSTSPAYSGPSCELVRWALRNLPAETIRSYAGKMTEQERSQIAKACSLQKTVAKTE
jgi:hypothetical protein